MLIIDSIHSIFDKKQSSCFCSNNIWEINEPSKTAIIKKVIFKKDDTSFGVINNDFYKSIDQITTTRSSVLKDKDCDGISFIDGGDKTHILLVDLKSCFSGSDISTAFEQDFFSFLKIHMMLSMCSGYILKSLNVSFYVACPKCKNTDEEDQIKDNILMSEEAGENNFTNKCMYSYFFKKKCLCKLKDIPYIKGRLLHDDLLSIDIDFNIITPEKYGVEECVVNLNLCG